MTLGATAAALGVAPGRLAALSLGVGAPRSIVGSELVYAIPAQDGVTIDREHEVILVRDRNVVIAFSLFCPHQKTRLKWDDDDRRFQCPKHKSAYQPDGAFISGRATRGMDRCKIRRDGASVVVDRAVVFEQDKDPAGWDAAVVRL